MVQRRLCSAEQVAGQRNELGEISTEVQTGPVARALGREQEFTTMVNWLAGELGQRCAMR